MSDIKLVLLGHFYNEEYLLPEWIRHHKPIFDRVILFDYKSTDRSLEILKDMAPEWEVRPSVNPDFDSQLINEELMRAEARVHGKNVWKICLNTTEFLFCKDPKGVIEKLSPSPKAIACRGVALFDSPEMENVPIESPLLKQRHFGQSSDPYKYRLLHNWVYAPYMRGRHGYDSPNPSYVATDEIAIAWLGHSPFTKEFTNRKLQIKNKVSKDDISKNLGMHHLRDEAQIYKDFKQLQSQSSDLLNYDFYKKIYNELYGASNE